MMFQKRFLILLANKLVREIGPFLVEAFTYRTSSHVGTVEEENNIKYRDSREQIYLEKK